MANDVQPISGTSAKAAARLSNMPTGTANLLPAHLSWLGAVVLPMTKVAIAPWDRPYRLR
jgi:hypothetical protein